jgi:outer membrane autotransporter protein
MKKIKLLSIALTFSLLSSTSFAKTEGAFVGLNLINSETKIRTTGDDSQIHRNDSYSYGLEAGYAFNFNNFFIAPNVFFNDNNLKSDHSFGEDRNSQNFKHSYGVKVNLGYDVTDKFSPFLILGHSETRLDESTYGPNYDRILKEYGTREGFVYGLGVKYSLTDNIGINAAYELTQFGLTSKIGAVLDGTDNLSYDYRLARVGVSYNF